MSDPKTSNQVDLIVATPASDLSREEHADRKGGHTHGLKEAWVALWHTKSVDVDVMGKNFEQCIGQVNKIISHLKNETVLGWEAESVSVGFAVSAEGSIGIATVGAEASIEVTFTPKKQTKF